MAFIQIGRGLFPTDKISNISYDGKCTIKVVVSSSHSAQDYNVNFPNDENAKKVFEHLCESLKLKEKSVYEKSSTEEGA
mgnify:CR=1